MARRTYTPDEYQAQRVNYYDDFGGINVNVAAAAGEEEKKEELPNVLTPVSARGDGGGGGSNPLTYSTMSGKSAFKTERIDPTEYIKKFANKQKVNFSDDGFQKYLEANAGPSMVGLATGIPLFGAVAYGAASLNRKRQLENANKIKQTGGGFMVEYNGQTISRAPGSRFYEGTLGSMSQDQFAAIEAIQNKFIPGTMVEQEHTDPARTGFVRTGKAALYTGSTFAIDAYGNLHSASGIQGGRAFEAEEARQGFMRQELDRMGLTNVTFTDAQARDFITQFRSQAGAGRPFAGFNNTVRTMDDTAYAGKVSGSQKIIQNILGGMGFTPPKSEPSGGIMTEAEPTGTVGSSDGDDRTQGFSESQISDVISTGGEVDYGDYSDVDFESIVNSYDFVDEEGGARYGGRIGMQEGGAAQRPVPEAGFVAGPPENFTERETVADDQNGAVAEGTFVINAAAVEFAGSNDIRKMILDAYSTAREKGLDIGRVDRKLYEGTVDVALSKGEVVVPPDLAKIIGYDRLEKINNRGKKEVSRRQKKAGGGFLDGKKFADGGEIYEDRIIMEEVRRKMDELLKNLPDDVKVTSKYFEDDYPATQEFYQEFARLNDADPDQAIFTLRPFAAGDELINAPRTPTLLNLFALAEEIAHLEDKKYAIPEPITSQIIRADRRTGFDQEPGTDAFMRKQYGQYEEGGYESLEEFRPEDIEGYKAVFGYDPTTKRNVFDYPEYYLMERQYAEEMRAKKFAFDVVFGSMPEKGIKDTKIGKSIQFTKDSYGTEFARYILQTASPTIQKGLFAKYPELRERYFDDKGRFINRKIMPDDDFRMAMSAENAIMAERTQKEFEASPDNRGFLDKLLKIPRKSTYIEGYGREQFDDPQAPPTM